MKEIEIKARLREKEKVMEKLRALGCVFEKPVRQADTVYAERVGSLQTFRTNSCFLRLRVKDGKRVLFTVKKRMANDLDAIEHEAEVGSRDEMEKALLLMGYQEAARLIKMRERTEYNGCEICVDEVEDLGSFIEMEKLAETGDSATIQEELFTFFTSLGIAPEDRMWSGYDILMMEKKEKGG